MKGREAGPSSPGPAGLIAKLTVKTADGQTTAVVTDAAWRCTDSPGANWHNRDIRPDDWPACRVIGAYGVQPWGKLKFAKLL